MTKLPFESLHNVCVIPFEQQLKNASLGKMPKKLITLFKFSRLPFPKISNFTSSCKPMEALVVFKSTKTIEHNVNIDVNNEDT